MNRGIAERTGNRSVMKNRAGLTNIPVIGMCLHLNKFDITKLIQIEGFGTFHSFGHNAVDSS